MPTRKTNYKTRQGGTFDRSQKAAMLPELEEEIAKRQKKVMSSEKFPTWESRQCEEFRDKVRKAANDVLEETTHGVPRRRVEGTDEQRQRFINDVLMS